MAMLLCRHVGLCGLTRDSETIKRPFSPIFSDMPLTDNHFASCHQQTFVALQTDFFSSMKKQH